MGYEDEAEQRRPLQSLRQRVVRKGAIGARVLDCLSGALSAGLGPEFAPAYLRYAAGSAYRTLINSTPP
jgi:hypothetical protein